MKRLACWRCGHSRTRHRRWLLGAWLYHECRAAGCQCGLYMAQEVTA